MSAAPQAANYPQRPYSGLQYYQQQPHQSAQPSLGGLPQYPQQAPSAQYAPAGYVPMLYAPAPRTNQHGVAALVLGILGLFLPLLAIPGLICSIAGLKEAKHDPAVPTGMSVAGLICSIIGLIWIFWGLLFLLSLTAAAM